MKLLKLIIAIFMIYFVRRFYQMYKVMKSIQENQAQNKPGHTTSSQAQGHRTESKVVDVDFKVID